MTASVLISERGGKTRKADGEPVARQHITKTYAISGVGRKNEHPGS